MYERAIKNLFLIAENSLLLAKIRQKINNITNLRDFYQIIKTN